MITEVKLANEFLLKKFKTVENIKSGVYAIPYKSSKGAAFMRLEVTPDIKMKDFSLFKDKELTKSWY